MPGKSEFTCETCGRRFAWKPEMAGKKAKCKCGVAIVVPETDPAAEEEGSFAGFELDLPEEETLAVADAGLTNTSGKCITCNQPIAPGAVICVKCGADQRTGQKIHTGVEELDTKTRRKANRAAAIPLWGMRTLQVGMWCNLIGVVLIIAGIPLLIAAGAMGLSGTGGLAVVVIGIAGVVAEFGGLGLCLLGPLLCLFVPGEAQARGVLVVSLLFTIGAALLDIFGEVFAVTQTQNFGGTPITTTQIPMWVGVASTFLNIAGVVCFLYFLVMLAKYLDFPEVSERAEKTLAVYVIFAIAQLIALIPFIGCFAVIAIIIYGIYALYLYIALLVDLNRSLSYRIGQMQPD
ncbi:MAG: hypothetical protein AAGB29_01720 [Planctomycetota bacterium]